ncbi:MAG TPA: class E sortase [Acidimicrobiales bacterium]|jgi:sortase A|nr:class E sortase [Acidimicrobiales bacterium]
MTVTHAPPARKQSTRGTAEPLAVTASTADDDGPQERPRRRLPSLRALIVGALVVVAVFLVAVGAVVYGIGSLVHARDQRALMTTERSAIATAAVEAKALDHVNLPTHPPAPGEPVGVLAIPALGINQAVVEGVGSSQTVSGPGHVPGTAGLGLPGNAAVVGRNAGYGGVFGRLDQLKPGDQVLTATIEGQSIYVVRRVARVTLGSPSAATGSTPTVSLKSLYRRTSDNRLTLVTSASATPWNSSAAIEVTAVLRGKPYEPTRQEARSPGQQGSTGDSGAWGELLLSLLALAVAAVGALFLYRRCTVRSAYLLSTAPIVACTVFAAEAISRLLPAWM